MQRVVSLLMLAGVLALLGPANALATGPSAGDQQYIDPLTGTTTHHSGSSSSPSTSAQVTPAASSSASGATATNAGVSTQTTPSATTASSTTTGDPSGTLPRTGFDAWLGAGFGACLLAGGAYLRWAVRRAS